MGGIFRGLLVGAIALSAAACHPSGGGGGGHVVNDKQLPKSNDVNPSPRPDTFIDDRAKQTHQGR